MNFSTIIYGSASAFSQTLGMAALINGEHVGGVTAIIVAMTIVVVWGVLPEERGVA